MQITPRSIFQVAALVALAGLALPACGAAADDPGSEDITTGTLQSALSRGKHKGEEKSAARGDNGKHRALGHCKHDGKHGDKDAPGGKHECGCDDDDGNTGTGVVGACDAYTSSGCGFFSGTSADCQSQLGGAFNVTACTVEFDAFAACAAGSTIDCSDRSGYAGCAPYLDAVDACLAANPL